MKYLPLLLILTLASCTTSEYTAEAIHTQATAEAASNPTSTANATGSLQPAPAGMSRAEARRYYDAQVAAAKAQQPPVPKKQKNSNNTTVEQKITNVTTTVLSLIAGLSAVVGCLVGFIIGKKL